MNWTSFCLLIIVVGITITDYNIITVYLQYIPPGIITPTTSLTPESLVTTSASVSVTNTPVNSGITYDGPYPFNETFSNLILQLHNSKRVLHGAQEMTWNTSLFEYASRFSANYDCSGTLTHSGGSNGENLALGYTVNGAIEAWYNEGNDYDYNANRGGVYNHFTQMIWNSSGSLGCATTYCNEVWGNYIVCEYFESGNIIGESGQNVFPLIA